MKSAVKIEEQAFWLEHFQNWERSGLSQKAYCIEHGIKFVTFAHYRHRFLTEQETPALNFVPVELKALHSVQSVASIQLMLPNGIRVGVSSEASEALLKMVLDVAGQTPC